jgi:hypothetical protein
MLDLLRNEYDFATQRASGYAPREELDSQDAPCIHKPSTVKKLATRRDGYPRYNGVEEKAHHREEQQRLKLKELPRVEDSKHIKLLYEMAALNELGNNQARTDYSHELLYRVYSPGYTVNVMDFVETKRKTRPPILNSTPCETHSTSSTAMHSSNNSSTVSYDKDKLLAL